GQVSDSSIWVPAASGTIALCCTDHPTVLGLLIAYTVKSEADPVALDKYTFHDVTPCPSLTGKVSSMLMDVLDEVENSPPPNTRVCAGQNAAPSVNKSAGADVTLVTTVYRPLCARQTTQTLHDRTATRRLFRARTRHRPVRL